MTHSQQPITRFSALLQVQSQQADVSSMPTKRRFASIEDGDKKNLLKNVYAKNA